MFGVYIHYPWCRNRCPYCDFAIAVCRPGQTIPEAQYLDALLGELTRRRDEFSGRRLESIYIGGGTPSLASDRFIATAIGAVRAAFEGEPDEVTLEANPCDCTDDHMAAWTAGGVTRLSVGVQSVRADELSWLGRDHRMGDGLAAIERAMAAGLSSLSADVILGTPAGADPLESVAAVAATGVPHVSVYELTIEERTPLGQRVARGEVQPRSSDDLADLYTAAHDHLTGAGYDHYEISSYALPGHRAVHNSSYWRLGEFLGIGNGAASFRRLPDGAGMRWTNPRSVGQYLTGGEPVIDRLTADDLAADRVWLGMRTADGVERAAFAGRQALISDLVAAGLAHDDRGHIRPTLRGFLLSDEVARRVVSGSVTLRNG